MQVMLSSMKTPVFVRPLTDAERAQLATGLRSSEAFVLRRSQILLASARGESAPHIARQLGCDDQTVRNAIAAFNTRGLAALRKGSSRPQASSCGPCYTRARAPLGSRPVSGRWSWPLA